MQSKCALFLYWSQELKHPKFSGGIYRLEVYQNVMSNCIKGSSVQLRSEWTWCHSNTYAYIIKTIMQNSLPYNESFVTKMPSLISPQITTDIRSSLHQKYSSRSVLHLHFCSALYMYILWDVYNRFHQHPWAYKAYVFLIAFLALSV